VPVSLRGVIGERWPEYCTRGQPANRVSARWRCFSLRRREVRSAHALTLFPASPTDRYWLYLFISKDGCGRIGGHLCPAWGFEDADVRTCQILSGLVSETVALAAGQEQMNILHSERATLLDALDRLQPHLSKLFNNASVSEPAQNRMHHQTEDPDETYLPPIDVPPLRWDRPRPCTFREILIESQEHGRSAPQDLEQEAASRLAPREYTRL